MDWYDTYWAALKAVIAAAWPEIAPGQLFLDTNIERRDWKNLIDSGQLSGVWVVVKIDFLPTPDWSANAVTYEVSATVNYVAPLSASGTSAPAPYLMSRLIALQSALYGAPTMGTVLSAMPLSANAENPINSSLIDSNQQFQAVSLTVTSLVVAYS